MNCKICGEPMEYTGLDDGGGDYGDSICDQWRCDNCDWNDENNCYGDPEALDDEYGDGRFFDEPYPTEDDPNIFGHVYRPIDDLPF